MRIDLGGNVRKIETNIITIISNGIIISITVVYVWFVQRKEMK
jgi:hypothetical protein